ncbi:AMP-binding protein [Bacillus amyloliquefaciens]
MKRVIRYLCGEYSSSIVFSDDTAYIIYTSGTTGTSKGVEVRK